MATLQNTNTIPALKGSTFHNWNDSAYSSPLKIVMVDNLNQLVEVIKDNTQYPSPVRVGGSFHSMNDCFATKGTQIILKDSKKGEPFFKKIDINEESGTVTVGAAVNMFELKEALQKRNKQIEVTPEIGNATAGSVACCGTKDSSLGDGSGQISSTVVGVKMVNALGEIEEISEETDLDRMREIRASYGLFGAIYQVTFKVQDAVMLHYDYKAIKIEQSVPKIKEIFGGADGVLGFLLPYQKRIIAERRFIVGDKSKPSRFSDFKRRIREIMWENGASFVTTLIPFNWFFYFVDQLFTLILQGVGRLGGYRARRFDSMINFKFNRRHYFDFTFWAIPVRHWEKLIPEFFSFCTKFEKETGFRMSLPTLVYFINQDKKSLLSFSPDEDIFTMDIADSRANNYIWKRFNDMHNQFISEFEGAKPVLSQTKYLNRAVVYKTLGNDWLKLLDLQKKYDPNSRFLSEYFYNFM